MKQNPRPEGQILLFQRASARLGAPNSLKEFLTYLKCLGERGKVDFSLAGNLETIHTGLSIKENYVLDSVPTSLIKDHELNFSTTAKGLKNPSLISLIEQTYCLERMVKDLGAWEKKLVSLVKGLLARSEYLFLEEPDAELPSETITSVKRAISFEARTHGRKVFIRPVNDENWLDIASHFVRKEACGSYLVKENSLAVASELFESGIPGKKAA